MKNISNKPVADQESQDYERQSEINDMKQHADKIIQGIKKLNDKDANRAIWELFQNAVDLSEGDCNVEIRLADKFIQFSHNGKPFTPITLDCLFKQVSSKTLEEKKTTLEEGEPVGQYGTGFITTHSFGKQVTINGALVKADGYVPIQSFVIDRDTDNWKKLGGRIRDLKKEVAELLKKEPIHATIYPRTSFTYQFGSKHHSECAEKAIQSLRYILPYVMTLSPTLNRVTVINKDDSRTEYGKKDLPPENDLHICEINIDGNPKYVYYLCTEDKKIVVILPFSQYNHAEDLPPELPRLFLYYPLVGTEDLGINYLIHSRHFQPTEPRDGLYLNSDNEDNQKEEAANRKLLDEASRMIFDYVLDHSGKIANPIRLARIGFNTSADEQLMNDYFKELKSLWIGQFKEYPIVETESGNIKPSETVFLHAELLQSQEALDAIYSLVTLYWLNTPKKHIVHEWTVICDEWDLRDIVYVDIEGLALEIEKLGDLEVFEERNDLKVFYSYLIGQGYSDLFNNIRLLPNIKGTFGRKISFSNNLSLPDRLYPHSTCSQWRTGCPACSTQINPCIFERSEQKRKSMG